MIDDPQRFEQLDDLGQAVQYHRRARSRSFRSLGAGLSRSRRILSTAADTTGNYFTQPLRRAPITFVTTVRVIEAHGAGGPLFAFGTTNAGVYVWMDGSVVYALAGNTSGVSLNAGGVQIEAPVPEVDDFEFELALACNPGTGVLAMWINGVLAVRGQSVGATLSSNEWAGNGGIGVIGVEMTGAPGFVTNGVELANIEFVEALSVYHRQLPRQLLTKRV